MANNKSWTFLSMVQFLLCTSVVSQSNVDFQENIAANKSVTQSSNLIYPKNTHNVWPASNAVDGIKNCSFVDKDHYSGTADEQVPWWQVDLGNIYSLSTIIVYGQPNEYPVQLKGFQVYLLTSENSKDKQHIYNNTNYVNGVFLIPLQHHVFGRYVRIEMPGNYRFSTLREGPLLLCEVEVYPTDIIQRLKDKLTTSMSSKSTYLEQNINWDDSRAIDGVKEFKPDSCSCCSGTNGADIPWWRLVLPKPYIIAQVVIYGRSESNHVQKSSDLFVYGSNSTTENGTLLFHGNPNRNSFIYSISLKPPRLFRILTIRRWIIGFMTICEIKMFQAGCSSGSFGDKCLERCNCRHGVACDVNTGHCDSCPPGYIGDSCQTSCQRSSYGYNCNETCDTCTQMDCRNTDGKCSVGCVPGYKQNDPYCKEACEDGQYGQNCSKSCSGHCKNGNKQCNKTNGNCIQGCVDGYKGERCEKRCSASTFGKGCTQICNTCKDLSCYYMDGLCLNGCAPGYKFDNPYCKTKCPVSTYGTNCTQTCRTCKDMTCNNTDGLCFKGCVPGYNPDDPYCKTICKVGKFGRECTLECHCADNKPCNQLTGNCQSTACETGWQGSSCNETCPPETFGDNCSENCYCAEGTCTHNYGICPGKCRQGYHGAQCNQVGSDVKRESEGKGDTAIIIGVVGVIGALIGIAVIVRFVILKYRMKKRDSVQNEYETSNRGGASLTESQEYNAIDNATTNSTYPEGPDYTAEIVTGH